MGRISLKSRLLSGCGLLALTLICGVQAAYADPPAIGVSPPPPVKTGIPLTFSASPENSAYAWDLDGDGVTDKQGSSVTWGYRTPGPVTVTVQAEGGDQGKLPLTVLGPNASFQIFPPAPITGQPIQFVYTPTEPIEALGWDLNGDGTFDDAKGQIAAATFAQPGVHAVSLQVTDIQEPPARSTSTQLVRVAAPAGPVRPSAAPARLMSPFPVVRITGKVSRRGARIKRLSVRAPYGSTVSVRCRGRGCPFRRSNRTLALAGRAKTPSKTVTIRRLARRLLHGGATVKVLVTRQGEIGKYTRFRIRRGKAPLRTDLCLPPGAAEPSECPSS
jgi:hypothetical protein